MPSNHLVLRALLPAACVIAHLAAPAPAQEQVDRQLTADDLKSLEWRSIGPANMGGRVAAIAMAPGNPKTFFVGYATGGVWKTTNNGTTFAPVFDEYETSSIGSLAVCDAPEDWPGWKDEEIEEGADRAKIGRARIVWVGTGEGNGRNSSSWGHGVYRSTDGAAKFTHLGLAETHDIPDLAVDPRDPDTCYVAALGHLWGANDERGVYKTDDGGRTWDLVLHIDDGTGACAVLIDPHDPDTVYAAMYARRRTAYSYRSGGPEGGIYRSRNAGRTWTKLTRGLPGQTGRIGLDASRSTPGLLLAVIESDEGGWIKDPWINRQRAGGVFRSDDGGDTWQRLTDFNPRSFYFSRVRIDPADDQRVYLLGWTIYTSDDGGRTFRDGLAKAPHVDYHAMVIDPDDTDHILVGNDGGLYATWDRGKTWDFHDHMAVGQFYNIELDMSDPYRVGGGLQDNGTWIGTGETLLEDTGEYMGRAGSITNKDWWFVFGGDGFHVAFDPEDPSIIYAEWQGGNINRIHRDVGQWRDIKPGPKEGELRLRFNWNAPFFISPHDSRTLYLGGNHVFKLTERGDRWERISADLSSREYERIDTVGSEAETNGTVVALAESPLKEGLLWAGTDDGLVHVRANGGSRWTNVTPRKIRDQRLYVSKIEPSHHDPEVAYVAVDGHRSDRFDPILYKTTDGGHSWESIAGNLPDGAPVKVIREDPHSPDVLFVGTERAAYVTVDCGTCWVRLNGKTLPTVAVDDLKVHPRDRDLVAGTHGRSIYVLDDVSALSQLTQAIMQENLHVFEPPAARPRHRLEYGELWSDRLFVAKNPAQGAVISYWIRDYRNDDVKVTVTDAHDHQVIELKGTNRPGLNRVVWDLQADKRQRLGNPHGVTEFVATGDYTVNVAHGELKGKTTLTVLPAPEVSND